MSIPSYTSHVIIDIYLGINTNTVSKIIIFIIFEFNRFNIAYAYR